MTEELLSDYLTTAQLARQLGKEKRTLMRWHKRGIGLARSYVGGTPLYSEEPDPVGEIARRQSRITAPPRR